MGAGSGHGNGALEHVVGLDRKSLVALFSVLSRDAVEELEICYAGTRMLVRREAIQRSEAPLRPSIDAAPEPAVAHTVTSPGVGRFRAAVGVHERVAADQVVGTLDVLGMVHAVTAPSGGIVTEVLVADARLVEFGQPLLVVCSDCPDR
jgi:biotin carboxyl carrier protein